MVSAAWQGKTACLAILGVCIALPLQAAHAQEVFGGGDQNLSALGRDPSVCQDDAQIARHEQRTGTVARLFGYAASGSPEGRLGRYLETQGLVEHPGVCKAAPGIVMFIPRDRLGQAVQIAERFNAAANAAPAYTEPQQPPPYQQPAWPGGPLLPPGVRRPPIGQPVPLPEPAHDRDYARETPEEINRRRCAHNPDLDICGNQPLRGRIANDDPPPPGQHGVFFGYINEFNAMVDRVPGMAQALQTGSVVTRDMAEELKRHWDLSKSPDQGVRLMIEVIESEGVPGLGQAMQGVGSAVRPQLKRLLEPTLTEAARKLNAAIANIEAREIRRILATLRRGVNKALIEALQDQERGANPRINRIVAALYAGEKAGMDPRQLIREALNVNRIPNIDAEMLRRSQLERDLIERNLLNNLGTAHVLGLFNDPKNVQILRAGHSVEISEDVLAHMPAFLNRTSIDHIIPVDLAPELATHLANLKLLPLDVNVTRKNTINEGALVLAEQYRRIGILTDQSYQNILEALAKSRGADGTLRIIP